MWQACELHGDENWEPLQELTRVGGGGGEPTLLLASSLSLPKSLL